MSIPAARVCGAIIAGGASTRFGSPKALAEVGGVRVIDRVTRSLKAAAGVADVIAIVNDPGLGAQVSLPHRPDVLSGAGALAGVHAPGDPTAGAGERDAVELKADPDGARLNVLSSGLISAQIPPMASPQSTTPPTISPSRTRRVSGPRAARTDQPSKIGWYGSPKIA